MEAPVHLVVDMSFFGCELQYLLCSFALVCGAARRQNKINVPVVRASFYVRASSYTFEKRHEGICRISHAVDMSVSSELKAR